MYVIVVKKPTLDKKGVNKGIYFYDIYILYHRSKMDTTKTNKRIKRIYFRFRS